jgi:hypothetical protein
MTSPASPAHRNHWKSHAASRLQPAARMRSLVARSFVAATLTLIASAAQAQSITLPMTGTCAGGSGTTFAGQVGLAVPDGNSFDTIQTASVSTVFGAAECQCPPPVSNQINLEIKPSMPFPAGTTGNVLVFVGSTCENPSVRSTGTPAPCEQLTQGVPAISAFIQGQGSNLIHIPIPGNVLFRPNDDHACTNEIHSNNVYVFIGSDPNNPIGTCFLSLTEQNQPPTAPANARAAGGDSSVTVSWDLPGTSGTNPTFYQVLCADDCGNPITNSPPAPLYSTCIGGTLDRRTLNTGGTTTTLDGGTTSDLGTTSRVGNDGNGLQPLATPAAICTDMGVNSTFTSDMGGPGLGPLADLDPRFVCSGQIAPTTNSARITGLVNGGHYHFVVVGVDNYGNAAISNITDAQPEPTEDLYRRYRDSGGAAGHCFIATAAFGSYESGWVQVLRQFRDEVLLPNAPGRAFVAWYYAHSPPAANWIAQRNWARAIVRVILLPVIAAAFLWLYFAGWQKLLFVLVFVAYRKRKRLAQLFGEHLPPATSSQPQEKTA